MILLGLFVAVIVPELRVGPVRGAVMLLVMFADE
jgi:hypothetical protein